MLPTRLPLMLALTIPILGLSSLSSFAAPRQTPVISPAPSFPSNYMEQIPLRYVDPAKVAASLQASGLPDGVVRVSPAPGTKHSLRVIGTQDGIAAVRDMATLLDVAPQKVTLNFRILRRRFFAGGKHDSTVLRTTQTVTTHNIPVAATVRDTVTGDTIQLTLTPRLSSKQPKRVALTVQFGIRFADGSTVGLGRGLPMGIGAPSQSVIGLTKNEDKTILNTVALGRVPSRWREPFTAYYVEAQAMPPSHKLP